MGFRAAPLPVAAQIREALLRDSSDLAIIDLVPFSEQLRRSLADQRMNADIASGFGGLGLLLAATGVFTVTSYSVARRRREFAIRVAVGATAREISLQVLRDAGTLIAAGLALGLLGAAAMARVLVSVLYGVSPFDPFTFVAVPLLLGAVGLLSAWLPARQAARVDPAIVLREE